MNRNLGRSRFAILALLAGLWLISTSPAALARPKQQAMQQARELFKRAEVHFNLGEFKAARRLYRQAYSLKPLPGFLFNIAQCHRNMGQYKQAVFLFKQYLARFAGAPNRAEVEKLIQLCREKLTGAEGKSGEGQKTSTLSAPSPAVEAPTPKLAPAVEAPIPTSSPAVKAPIPEAVDLTSGDPSIKDDKSRSGIHRAWFWSAAGLGGALLITGAVSGALALSQSDTYKLSETSYARQAQLKESGETLSDLSTATCVLGAVAAVGAGVLFFFTDWGKAETRVSAAPSLQGGAIFLSGRF